MKLYYSPGACSLASHIALIEGGVDFEAVKVDLKSKETENGEDFRKINARGYVPAIDTKHGLITENPAVLTFIADKTVGLPKGEDFYRMLEWIGFTGTEIHGNYHALFGGGSDEEKQQARDTLADKYKLAARLMDGSDWLVGDAPGVADNYLFVTTLWAKKMDVDLPNELTDFRARNMEREPVKKAMQAEGLS